MSETEPRNGGFWRSPWTIAAAVLIGAVIVISAWYVVTAVLNPADSAKPEVKPAATAEPDTSADSACGLAPGDQSVPTTAGPEVEWELVGTIAAPGSPELGPGTIRDGIRSCYAHSPAGALVAMANYAAQQSTAELSLGSAEQNMAEGPGKEIVLEEMRARAADGSDGSANVSVQIAGFKVLDYSDEKATIELVAHGTNGVIMSFPGTLSWEDGDWKLVVQENGQPELAPRQLSSLVGYVAWAGA